MHSIEHLHCKMFAKWVKFIILLAFKTWFNPWIKGSEGIMRKRRRTYVCHKGWNLQTISTMHPKKGIIPLLLRKIQTPPLFSSLNEHHHLSLQKQRNGEKQGGLFYLEMMTAEQLNWLCLFPSPPPRKNPNSHYFKICQKVHN